MNKELHVTNQHTAPVSWWPMHSDRRRGVAVSLWWRGGNWQGPGGVASLED